MHNQQMTEASEAAFKAELVAFIPHMRAFARSLCRDPSEAEDIAQDAMVSAWAKRGSFMPGTNFKAWLFMIVRNRFYSNKRRDWRSTELDPETAERTLVANDNPAAIIELDDLRRALSTLSDEQREALILIGAGGLSYEETAEICGVAVGTVKSRVSRARTHLIAIYRDGVFETDGLAPSGAMAAIFREVEDYQRASCA
ncbi:MAG TPA: sigma-70 family RNA polymerase sigma factor [Phenylobacterium sp.]|jgi:RNA polymerase sigma-70 factor (ECF subfamily)|uniref:sigma-70 family RNA polymerase sigma factor n=1 Tax=Phenylobacterium sp. TaxID=1871053 RepID=UPI002D6C13F2|nr:sigma-70 family RNA polymerase sigma factor [Phenylobacterium sp.]HZZ70359.1 sigma-70 family RNA polymerase sigma factor [Phenylobacterium sp.]